MTDVETIKSKLDIVSYIGEFVTLKKSGRNYKGLCPFHGEKTPSFYVSPERGTWHCFGCHEGGDIITFLQKWENIEFIESLKILADKVGITLSGFTPTESFSLKEKIYGINHLASEFYHYILTSHKFGEKALEYLKNRHIKPETMQTFALGYSPNSWDNLKNFLNKKGYENDDLVTAGLLIKSDRGTYYDRFRGRVMFALRDSRGNTVGFSGRVLPPGSEKEAKYINSPETPVYIKGQTLYGLDITKDSIKKEKYAVVVEGEIDLIASFQSGVSNVVAIKGSALTAEQVVLLKRYTEEVRLALDSDFAGNEAARRGIDIAENGGLTVKVVQLIKGKDPADCVENGAHFWKQSVEKSVPIYDFIIDTAFKKYDVSDVSGIKKIGAEVVPFLSKITNPIILSHYVKLIAKKLDVSEASVEDLISNFQMRLKKSRYVGTSVPAREDRQEQLEEYLLSIIIQSPNWQNTLQVAKAILSFNDDFKIPAVSKILDFLDKKYDGESKLDINEVVKLLPSELSAVFDKAFLIDLGKVLEKKDTFEKELKRTIMDIKKIGLRRKLTEFSTQIRQAEEKNDENAIVSLSKQVNEVNQSLQQLEK